MMLPYVELHCHSYFSLLDGASSPEDLLLRASELGMPALALVDHDAVYGAVRFSQAANQAGIHPILGAEITLQNAPSKPLYHLTLLVESEAGWRNLCQLVTLARHNAPKGEARLPLEKLRDYTDGLIALSGCSRGEIAAALLRGDDEAATTAARNYVEWFGHNNFFIELQNHLLPHQDRLNVRLADVAQRVGVGVVATNNVHYATQDRHRLQDVLVCIRHNISLDEAGQQLRPNSEFYLKCGDEMALLFLDTPATITNTLSVAEHCQFDLHFGLQALPVFPTETTSAFIAIWSSCAEQGCTPSALNPRTRCCGSLITN